MKTKAMLKKTWDVIKELTNIKRRNNVQPSKLTLNNDNTVSEPQIIAEEFNRFFVNIGKEMAASIQPNDSNGAECSVGEKKKITNSIFLLPSCQQEVFNLIKELKNRKATRTLDIETKFIKLANPIISFFLSELFNLCLSTGTYPDLMKVAEVIPIFKKGQKDKLTNYRPISLLSQFNKIFEKLLHSRIYSYLSKFNLFSERQFGFRKNYSTSLAICNIYDELLNNVDEGKYSCCIFF